MAERSDYTESQILPVSKVDDNDPRWTLSPLSAK